MINESILKRMIENVFDIESYSQNTYKEVSSEKNKNKTSKEREDEGSFI